jgi:uncharacterized protein (DUF433 family)
MPNLDWSQCPAVESIPGKVSGAWVLKGTRMPVQTVFANLEAGMSVRKITEVFDVKPEEVLAALRFVTESLEKEPAYAALMPESQVSKSRPGAPGDEI